MNRCLEANESGARCILGVGHDYSDHLWPSVAYKLGKLQSAVTMFLAGVADREFLARTLAETEQG